MHVLVLGGNGFIGSHLVDALHARGHRIRVFDHDPVRHKEPQPDIDYHTGNFSDSARLAEALQHIDIVYHLISTTVPGTSNPDPVADINSNLVATVQLLQQMVNMGIRQIVFLSSGGTVYGNPDHEPVPETHPLRPICSHGVVKVAIENYLHMFHQLHGLRPVVLRASNPFGARQGHIGVQGVISTFIQRLLDGDRVQIWGDGSTVRDYIYIDDLVELCVRAGETDVVGIFNAGSGSGYSLNEILAMIERVSGRELKADYLAGRDFDVKRITLDISLAREVFKWAPRIPTEEGIRLHWKGLHKIPK